MKHLRNTSRWIKLVSVALLAALAIGLLGNVNIANAQSGENDSGRLRLVLVMGEALLKAAADATNLTQLELLQQMQDGNKTLAEVIKDDGSDLDAVKAAAKVDLTDKINQAVKDNKLTQDQADTILKNLDTALDKLVTSPWPVNALTRLVQGVAMALLNAAVQVTKLTQQDIIQQMAGGKTLAEVITANGSDVDAVKTVAEKMIADKINQAVASKLLTQDQADAILNNVDVGLDRLLNSPWPNVQNIDPSARLLRAMATGLLVKETATESNISQRDLLKEARAGKSLAQIATGHGADPAKIITAVTNILTDNINAYAKNGKISQDEATRLIGSLPGLLKQIMSSSLPGRPGTGNAVGTPGANATPPPQATPSL